MSSIDEIKPLLVLLVALIGLRVVLVGALKALTGQRATSTATTAPRLDPAPFLARGQHGAEWAHSPSGGWERVDEGAVPPIDYPPGLE